MGLRLGLPCCGCRERIWRVHISSAWQRMFNPNIVGQEFIAVGTPSGFTRKLGIRGDSVVEYPAWIRLENVTADDWQLTMMVNHYGRETIEFTNDFETEIADVEFTLGQEIKSRFVVTVMPFDQERPADFAWFPHRATFGDIFWVQDVGRELVQDPITGIITPVMYSDKKTRDVSRVELDTLSSDSSYNNWSASIDAGTGESTLTVRAERNKPSTWPSPGYLDIEVSQSGGIDNWVSIGFVGTTQNRESEHVTAAFFLKQYSSIFPVSNSQFLYHDGEEIGLEQVDWTLQDIDQSSFRTLGDAASNLRSLPLGMQLRSDSNNLFDASQVESYVIANPEVFHATLSSLAETVEIGLDDGQECSVEIIYDKLLLKWSQKIIFRYTLFSVEFTIRGIAFGEKIIDYNFGEFDETVGNPSTRFVTGTPSGSIVPAGDVYVDLSGTGLHVFQSPIYQHEGRKLTSEVVTDLLCYNKFFTAIGNNLDAEFNWKFAPAKLASLRACGTLIQNSNVVVGKTISIHQGSLPTGITLNSSTGRIQGSANISQEGKVGFVRVRVSATGGREFITEPYVWAVGTPVDILMLYESPYTNAPTQPATGFDWRIDDAAPYEIEATVINATNPIAVTLLAGTLPPSATIEATTGRIHSGGVPVITTPSTGSCTLRVTDDDARTNDTVTYNWQYVGEDDPVFVGDLYPSPYSNTATPPSTGFDWRFTDAVTSEILTMAEIDGSPFDPAIYDFAIIAGSLPLDYFVDTDGTIRSGMSVETSDFTGSVQVRVTQTATGRIKTSRVYNWQFFGGAPPPPPPPPPP